MALWAPRVVRFVNGLPERVASTPLPDFLDSITPRGSSPAVLQLTAAEMTRVIWNVLRWNRGRFNNGCFVRSFTRYRFLREIGLRVVFNLGVEAKETLEQAVPGIEGATPSILRRRAPELQESQSHLRSHAWLTLDGLPFMEFEPERFADYRVLLRHPSEKP
jgi:hypothetical protein